MTEPALVIENDPNNDIRRLGDWLTEAGLELVVCRAHHGDPVPETLDGFSSLIVLGGEQSAYPIDGEPGAAWLPELESLLRKAVRYKVPTLAICFGAQVLATALGGVVERSAAGPELGARLVARRDAAEQDALWRYVPFVPDVLQWHYDEITHLPAQAVLLAASTNYPHQAYRVGERAWGMQFHIESDVDMIAEWAGRNPDLGADAQAVVDRCADLMDDIADVWQPFAQRFAAVARGELSTAPGRTLPLLGH